VRVALIGSTGFIGRHVARWLTTGGHDVIGIQRGSSSTQIPGVRNLTADHQDLPALASALAQAAPTIVVDMVAYTADDTDRLTAALPATVRRLIIISSGDVYWTYDAFRGFGHSEAVAERLSESAPLRERLFPYRPQASGPEDRLYSYEKILVEQRGRAGSPVPVTVLRLPMVYGPRDPNRRVGAYLQRMATESSVLRLNPAEAQWHCTRGYVEDVAWAISLAAVDDRAAGEVYNIGEPEALTEQAWAGAIAQAAGWPGRVVADPSAPPSLPANWSVPLTVDSRHIRAHLGYEEPVGRVEGLRRTIQAAAVGAPAPGAA
jgi:nucleoside-diphosphate-sugar epimerase